MEPANFHSKLLLLTTLEGTRREIESWAGRLGWLCCYAQNHKHLLSMLKDGSYDLLILDEIVDGGNSLLHMPEIRERAPKSVITLIKFASLKSDKAVLFMDIEASYLDYVLNHDFGRNDLEAILIQARYQKIHAISPRHILVIDDCRTIRKIVMKTLKDKHYRVSEARSAEEALGRSDIGQIDALITDIFLPGMGGIEAIQKFKSNWPEMAIVAMSAGDKSIEISNILLAAKKIGADKALSKPFNEQQLIDTIEAALRVKYLAV